ncbi:MAG: nucleoside monophosphate kinase [Bacteroidota bacterium]
MEILIITGPPYSGKGTQCEIIKEQVGYHHISTGDRCRLEKENKTVIGKIMSVYEEKGDLVPDSIMKDLFEKIIDENLEEKGIILDGYPRTTSQVKDLIELTSLKGLKISKVISIDVPHDELLKRAQHRAETSNRADDKDLLIHQKRIDVFEEHTQPAIDYMNSKLEFLSFNGLGSIEEVTKNIFESLNHNS